MCITVYICICIYIRIRMVYFGIIRYAVYMYMEKKIIYSNTFLESKLWLTAAGIRIPCTVTCMLNLYVKLSVEYYNYIKINTYIIINKHIIYNTIQC